MIENDTQYKLTKDSLDGFNKTMEYLKENPDTLNGLAPAIIKAKEDCLQSMIDELSEEIEKYEASLS